MSRTVDQIQTQIIGLFSQSNQLSALDILTPDEIADTNPDSTSKVAEWRRWVWVVAVSIWVMEKLFDVFKQEIEKRIAATRPHTKGWYRGKALLFQYGDTLNDKDYYDVIDPQKQIIKYASIRKLILSGRGTLLVKVAKESNDSLAPLSATERYAFTDYMEDVTDAGTFIKVQSYPADSLKLELDVYYDPQLIDESGNYIIDGTSAVIPAINSYLRQMDFDSRLILTKLIDTIQSVKGIKYPVLKKVYTKKTAGSYEPVFDLTLGIHNEFSEPESGWYELDVANTVINYIKLEG
jgi:hypothetical protein